MHIYTQLYTFTHIYTHLYTVIYSYTHLYTYAGAPVAGGAARVVGGVQPVHDPGHPGRGVVADAGEGLDQVVEAREVDGAPASLYIVLYI
jgi:hypothetical protein